MFTDEFLENLPEDMHEAIAILYGEFTTINRSMPNNSARTKDP